MHINLKKSMFHLIFMIIAFIFIKYVLNMIFID